MTENCWFMNPETNQHEYSALVELCERCRKFDEVKYQQSRKVVADARVYHKLLEALKEKMPLFGQLDYFELSIHTQISDYGLAELLNELPKLRIARVTAYECEHAAWMGKVKPTARVYVHNIASN